MRQIMFSTPVYAPLVTVWELLLLKAEYPQNYLPGVVETRWLEKYADGFLREVRTEGMVIRERVTVDEPKGEIRYLLVEHPLFSGQVINRVVPTARQSPVAPQILTIIVDWLPKDEAAEQTIRESMPAQIQQEVLSLKEMAEERASG